ncbi:uncharacterized protein LOC135928098 isoform X1 [Gordionus sp. m RMFG-2023]|uniref:uncharacterized protein LOC135928098 isoform X1 n=1 Tax=Gordionus sp. m RMFG-2023 TaxID=3053472 RepID=UPI0031FE233B
MANTDGIPINTEVLNHSEFNNSISPINSENPHQFSCVLELRKERSRDAARSRRGKENHEFNQLAKMLPLPHAITMQLDKASIIRLTTAFLKIKFFSYFGQPSWTKNYPNVNNRTLGCKISDFKCPKSFNNNSKKLEDIQRIQRCSADYNMGTSEYTNGCIASRSGEGDQKWKSMPLYVKEDIHHIENNHGNNILQALDGFAFALYNDGRILYISETVSIYLGLSQVEMTGSSIFDYVHIKDQREMAKKMGLDLRWICSTSPKCSYKSDENDQKFSINTTSSQNSYKYNKIIPSPIQFSDDQNNLFPEIAFSETIGTMKCKEKFNKVFCVRMKSTLSKRGNHVRQSGYRVLQILIRFRPQIIESSLDTKSKKDMNLEGSTDRLIGLVGIAIAPPPPALHEIKIDNEMFVMRLNLDFTVSSCEPKITQYTGIKIEDLMKQSFYNYCHVYDLPKLRRQHIDLIKKGQIITDYYRFMSKSGGYIWMQTCATVVLNTSKNAAEDDENIIFINYIISNKENPEYHYSTLQNITNRFTNYSSSPNKGNTIDQLVTSTNISDLCYSEKKLTAIKSSKQTKINNQRHAKRSGKKIRKSSSLNEKIDKYIKIKKSHKSNYRSLKKVNKYKGLIIKSKKDNKNKILCAHKHLINKGNNKISNIISYSASNNYYSSANYQSLSYTGHSETLNRESVIKSIMNDSPFTNNDCDMANYNGNAYFALAQNPAKFGSNSYVDSSRSLIAELKWSNRVLTNSHDNDYMHIQNDKDYLHIDQENKQYLERGEYGMCNSLDGYLVEDDKILTTDDQSILYKNIQY